MDVVVQVWGYREPDMDQTLRAVRDQYTPPGTDVTVEAWVTPHASPCATMDAARSVHGVSVYDAPRGKLSARNAAHASAVGRGTDVVVSWDGDAPPLHDEVLAALLEPHADPAVVATNGWYEHAGDRARLYDTLRTLDYYTLRPIYGRLSSLSAPAWEHAGPFDTTVNEHNVASIRKEEEVQFRRRVEEVGVMETVKEAVVHGDSRRYDCVAGRVIPWAERPEWCEKRGGATGFAPARRQP